MRAQFRLQQQRVRVEQVRQLLEREENILSDMLEQVIRYRVEQRRIEHHEIDKRLVEEVETKIEKVCQKKRKESKKQNKENNNTYQQY